jgi:hypothetical protein
MGAICEDAQRKLEGFEWETEISTFQRNSSVVSKLI